MSRHSARDFTLLMAAERMTHESGLMADLLRGHVTVLQIRPLSLIGPMTELLRSASGIHDASLPELQGIAHSVRLWASRN